MSELELELAASLSRSVAAVISTDDAGRRRTTRKLRGLDVELRRYVAHRFEGRRVEIVDRDDRTHVGTVLVVSVVHSGAFSDALTLRYDDPGLWPVTLSLATVNDMRELRPFE